MEITSHPSPGDFLQATAGFREHHRQWTNAMSTAAESRAAGRMPVEPGSLWISAGDGPGNVCGVGMSTPPHGFLASPMPEDAATSIANYLIARRPEIASIDGPVETARVIADRIAAATGRSASAGFHMRLLATDTIIAPSAGHGRMRPATSADADLVIAWMEAFSAESMPDHPANPGQAELLRKRLGNPPNTIYLWDVDGKPVSLCWQSLPAAGVVRISAVYTPPEHRGHGYASINVAALSQQALDQDAELVMLYTDATNPTSNKIYEAVGYRYVGEAIEWFLS